MPQYPNFDEDEIPMPRRGDWNQQQQKQRSGNGGGNQGQYQKNNQQQQRGGGNQGQRNDDKPSFKPPQSVRVQPQDRLYQLVTRWERNAGEELYWHTDTTFFVQGKGIADTTFGYRPSQVVGFTMFEATGMQRYYDENDYEFGVIKEKLDQYWTIIDELNIIAQEKSSKRRGRNTGQVQSISGGVPFFWRAVIVILAILTIIMLLRGLLL